MAHENFCIADSGGTSTTWVFQGGKGRTTLTTAGLPPRALFHRPALLDEAMGSFPDVSNYSIYFYGTGLSSADKASFMKNLLINAGFAKAEVFSDTLGACRATLAGKEGTVAILGTGSAVIEYNGSGIGEIRGGLGPFLGDEGSGYYFGKLVLHDYYNGFLSEERQKLVKYALGENGTDRKFLSDPSAPSIIAGLSSRLERQDFMEYHVRNLEEFIRVHFVRFPPFDRTLHVVGSYGSALQDVLQELFERKNWSLGRVIANPTEKLVEYHSELIEKNKKLNN